MPLLEQGGIIIHADWPPSFARKLSRTLYTSQRTPVFLRKFKAERVYMMIENRDPSGGTIYMDYNSIPQADGSAGIELIFGIKYELYTPFAPDNEIIWFVGSLGATKQRVNVTEGYSTDHAILR
jgi:hypothetical protein